MSHPKLEDVIKSLQDRGYTTDKKNDAFTGSGHKYIAKKEGIRIEFWVANQYNPNNEVQNRLIEQWIDAEIYARTSHGGFKKLRWSGDFGTKSELDYIDSIKIPEQQEKPKRGPLHFTFNTPISNISIGNYGRNATGAYITSERHEINVTIKSIAVIPVALEDNTITNNLSKPDAKIWFLANCLNFQGATFRILTDGEGFYPVTGDKISASVHQKKSLDISKLSAIDKQIVNLAIEAFKNGGLDRIAQWEKDKQCHT